MKIHAYIRKIALLFLMFLLIGSATGCFKETDSPDLTSTEVVTETLTEVVTETITEVATEAITEAVTETVTQSDDISLSNAHQKLLEANLKSWKLGDTLIYYAGNNRDYDWYLDQADTGEHAASNCGPTSVVMAAKWVNESFEGTAEDARAAFRPKGGWWYNDDIEGSLTLFDIDYDAVSIEDANTLKSIIDSGRIAIINNSMGYITRETDTNAHTNRFYDFDSGHYLILKGYVLVNQTTYFEVYDPNNWDMAYEDGTPMGKDRYYEASVFMDSIVNWYPYAIMINPEE